MFARLSVARNQLSSFRAVPRHILDVLEGRDLVGNNLITFASNNGFTHIRETQAKLENILDCLWIFLDDFSDASGGSPDPLGTIQDGPRRLQFLGLDLKVTSGQFISVDPDMSMTGPSTCSSITS